MSKKKDRYSDFLQKKVIINRNTGLKDKDISFVNEKIMFDYQKAVSRWALKKGKAAIFAGTGMGKTLMSLEFANNVFVNTNQPILMVAPLAVSNQTVKEARKFSIEVNKCKSQEDVIHGINITNYESLHKFDASVFSGVVLDESSIIKSFSGKIKNQIIEVFANTPYKLAATATPSPNSVDEILTHSEFLDILTRSESLATFFTHDSGDTSKWVLKGHAENKFWQWMASWSMMFTKPSDLGFSDEGFGLPPIHYEIIESKSDMKLNDDVLFDNPDSLSLNDKQKIRRNTIKDRCDEAAKIINNSDEQFIIWCHLNEESDYLAKIINDSVEVAGKHSDEYKEKALTDFSEGRVRNIITKPKIAGFGLNWQQCRNEYFVGIDDSWESFFQAVRRVWRFGQKKECYIYIGKTDKDSATLNNIKRKEAQAKKMQEEMVKHMKDSLIKEINDSMAYIPEYKEDVREGKDYKIYNGDSVELIKKIENDSVDFSVYSPPFSSLYTYSASERDMGNSKSDEEFNEHYLFLLEEMFRITRPGRVMAVHCMDMPAFKEKDGYIGVKDFPGEIIRLAEKAGFKFDGRITIWKDPVVAMQRTKSIRLLHKQLKKDSTISSISLPDYILKFKKPGENYDPVSHTNETFPVDEWQKYASPVWMDIKQGDVLKYQEAKESEDQKHICPLQLEVIERCLKLWSKEGDIVFSPFMGIGSEGYVSLKHDRKFIGIELKKSYFDVAYKNIESIALAKQSDLFAS